MKTTKYPEHFENLWKYFLIAADEGLIGSLGKKKAYDAYVIKECTPEDSEYLIKCLSKQITNKKNELRFNGFTPNFQTPERWIRNERFADEIHEPIKREAVRQSKSERRDEEARRYLEEDNGCGVEGSTGHEVST